MSLTSYSPNSLGNLGRIPVEIRVMIYGYVLTPNNGYIYPGIDYQADLIGKPTNTIKGARKAKTDFENGMNLSILRVSRQVYHEARDVLFIENTVYMVVKPLKSASINIDLIPSTILPRLRKIVLVVIPSTLDKADKTYWCQANWSQIQTMTAVREAHVSVIARDYGVASVEEIMGYLDGVLRSILESLPGGCRLKYGHERNAVPGKADSPERKFAKFILKECNDKSGMRHMISRGSDLEERVKDLKITRGLRSGRPPSRRAPGRSGPSVLVPPRNQRREKRG